MSVKSRIATLTRKGEGYVSQAGRLMVQFGLVLADVDTLIREHGEKSGYKSIRVYIESAFPSYAGPVYGSSDGYRALQAGRVANVVGDVGDASVDALTFLHRFIDNPSDLLKVWRHAKGRKAAAPTRAALLASATAVLGVERAQAGKAGPKAGSANAGNGARGKAAKAGTSKPKADTPKAEAAPSREVPVREVPPVTDTATKAAILRLRKVLGTFADPNAAGTVLVVMQNVAQACEDMGAANVLAAIHTLADEHKTPAPRKTRGTAAARKTRGNTARKTRGTKAAA